MSLFKKRHFGSALLMIFLVACGGGGDDSTQKTPQVSEQTLKVNSTFSATFLQWVKNDRSGDHLSSEASLNEVSEQGETNLFAVESKRYDGKMEVTDLLSNETNIYQWPVTQHIDAEGHVTTVSHRSLTLKPGSYDFVLLLTSQDLAKHQYLSKALGVVIVDGENPVLDFVLSPNLGETINGFEEIKYVSTLKFSWPNEDLAGFNAPQLGLTINQGEEAVYTINKQTGLAQVTMNVEPGEYSLVLHLYDGDLMVGKNANQDKPINLMEGEDTHINMISLQADIIISLDPLSSKGIFTFIVPPEVVNEVGAAHDLMLLVRLGGEGELQEQALTVIDENGVYKASGLFKTDGEKSILAYLAFHRVIDASNQYNEAPFAHCNTKVYIEQNQKLACKIELKRESIITQRLLGTLMLSVLDEQGLPSIGSEVFLNGKSIGLTGEHYSVGSIKTHQISGNYKLKAQNSTHSASAEVTLRPLEIVNKTLTLKPFLGNEIPDFNFVSITPSNLSDPKAMLRFLWDGQTQGNTYTVCAKDASQENACYPLASITGQAQLDVPLKATYLLAGKEFFILAQRGDARQNTLSLKIPPFALNSLVQKIKVGNANNDEFFSSAVALSADGNTLAVGASKEDLSAVGIDGHPLNRSGNDSGAVYIFKKEGNSWLQHTYLKASNANPLDEFGTSLSLSADGDTLVVGAPNESSNAKGVNGDELNNASQSSGAVYVFKQNNHVWQQHAYLKASNTKAGDNFGSSLSISPDGNTLAVAAKNEDSDAKGVNGIETNKSAVDSGAVYLFKQTGEAWQQDAYLKASNTGAGDNFGHSLSLNADGNILAVGGVWEDSNGTGLNGDQSNNEINKAGATYLFKNDGNAWQQQAYLKPALAIEGSEFGYSVSLSADGNTLAVGTRYDSYGKHVSTVYMFKQSGNTWQQDALIEGSDTRYGDAFGSVVSLSANADTLVVGASMETSSSSGVNGLEGHYDVEGAGAVYVFKYDGKTWQKRAFLKALTNNMKVNFGHSLSLSADGHTLAVGDRLEGVYVY